MGSSISIVPFIFQRLCDDLYQCLILVFFVIYLDSWGMGIYRVGAPVREFENFCSLFSFFLFFFLFYSSLFSLSLGGPFSSWAPGHCPPMPPSHYTTVPGAKPGGGSGSKAPGNSCVFQCRNSIFKRKLMYI